MLTKKQFDVLDTIIETKKPLTQREIAEKTGISVGSVNKILGELSAAGYAEGHTATENGLQAMEPYRVKRAVILAAGFGSRLVPITLNTPKPLIRVKGSRIIDSSLDALTDVGIEEIYIVRGYLAEQFEQLLHKYPSIRLVENPYYNEANNISSLMCARDLLQNAYIIEGDLLLYNKALIKKYQYQTNYLGIPVESTDDWCFYKSESGTIKKMAIGGTNCYRMIGLSYWTAEDGRRLAEDLADVYNRPGGKERYWDQVPLEYCMSHYKVGVRRCGEGDIVEIDTFSELKAIDEAYRT